MWITQGVFPKWDKGARDLKLCKGDCKIMQKSNWVCTTRLTLLECTEKAAAFKRLPWVEICLYTYAFGAILY